MYILQVIKEWTSIGETSYSEKIYSKNFQKEIYLLKSKRWRRFNKMQADEGKRMQ